MENARIVDGTERFVYRLREDGTAAILMCPEDVRELRIPETLDGVAVTMLDDGAIESPAYEVVHIPATVDCVHEAAFMADNVAEIVVDEGNDRFEVVSGALVEKASGTLIMFPPAASDAVLRFSESIRAIGDCAFSACLNLKQVILPESLTSIGRSAFEHCEVLTGIYIPSSVVHIGDFAFDDCPHAKLWVHTDCYHRLWGWFREFPDPDFEIVESMPEFLRAGYK